MKLLPLIPSLLAAALFACSSPSPSASDWSSGKASEVYAKFALSEVRPSSKSVFDFFSFTLYENKTANFVWSIGGIEESLGTTYEFSSYESFSVSIDCLVFDAKAGRNQMGTFSLLDYWKYTPGDEEVHYQSRGISSSENNGEESGYTTAVFTLV